MSQRRLEISISIALSFYVQTIYDFDAKIWMASEHASLTQYGILSIQNSIFKTVLY